MLIHSTVIHPGKVDTVIYNYQHNTSIQYVIEFHQLMLCTFFYKWEYSLFPLYVSVAVAVTHTDWSVVGARSRVWLCARLPSPR